VAEKSNAEPIEIRPKKSSPYDIVITMDGYLIKEMI